MASPRCGRPGPGDESCPCGGAFIMCQPRNAPCPVKHQCRRFLGPPLWSGQMYQDYSGGRGECRDYLKPKEAAC